MKCRVCDSVNLKLALDLGRMPWANNFLTKDQIGTEPYYPLRVVHCADCQTAQLDYTVPKETMFGDHTYRSGTTKSLRAHFKSIADEVHALMPEGVNVLDIGSNDGTQLACFKELGWRVTGVESSVQTAKAANDAGIKTVNKFFNEQTARELNEQFDVINAAGVFFHLEELHSVCDGIKLCLKKDGVFVVQFIYAKTLIENGAFDQIYHEHLLYYTLRTVGHLLGLHGLELFDAYVSPIHGGSVIGFVGHKHERKLTTRLHNLWAEEHNSGCNEIEAWNGLHHKVQDMKRANLEKLHKWKADGKRVYGMGAPVKGNTLLNTFGVTSNLIEFLTELNPLRRDTYAPGSHIPVMMENEVPIPDVQFCLAWNFKKEILERNKALIENGVEFWFPVDPS